MSIKVLAPILILAFVFIGVSSVSPQLTQLVKGKVGFMQKENDVIISDNNFGLDSEDSGEVVGVFTDNPQATPMPTPIGKKSTINPTPTPPATTTNNPNSNSPGGNESKNNPSNQQSNTSPGPAIQNTGILTPTSPTTSPTATIVPPTPTPDITPFEASWETGNSPLATITANKPLKRCLWKQWGVEEKAEGGEIASGNSCTILSVAWRTVEPHKLWVRAEAVSGETKEFGDPPPSQ